MDNSIEIHTRTNRQDKILMIEVENAHNITFIKKHCLFSSCIKKCFLSIPKTNSLPHNFEYFQKLIRNESENNFWNMSTNSSKNTYRQLSELKIMTKWYVFLLSLNKYFYVKLFEWNNSATYVLKSSLHKVIF